MISSATADAFDMDSLLAEAAERVGLDDYGDDAFREGLGAMLEMYATTARFTPAGATVERKQILRYLASRLRIEAAFRRHPEIRDVAIPRPIFVVGLPRTGTSILLNLLAKDPVARPLLHWEAVHPEPCEGLEPGREDPRLVRMREQLARYRGSNPDFDKIHLVDADGPEECVLLQAHSFSFVQMGWQPLVDPYKSWFEAQDHRASYAYYHDLLKMLQWQRPGSRWLLKSPAHLWALDVVEERFPGACIIHTHRDPLEIIPSYCSMIAMGMGVRARVDPAEIGRRVLDHLALMLERGLRARDRLRRPIVDSRYSELLADPEACVERIYEQFGLELPDEARSGLLAHLDSNPKAKHGSHEYALAQYGLSEDQVQDRLSDYIARFSSEFGA